MQTLSKVQVKSSFSKAALGFSYLGGLVAAIVIIATFTFLHLHTLARRTIPQPVWQSSAFSRPLATADGVVVAYNALSAPHALASLDAATGVLRWKLSNADFVAVDATQSHVFYVGDPLPRQGGDTRVGMVDAADGTLGWTFDLPAGMATLANGVTLTDTRCFIFATSTTTDATSPDYDSHMVYILDPRTGQKTGGYALAPSVAPSLLDGTMLFAQEHVQGSTDDQIVHALNAFTGKPLWQTEVPNARYFVAMGGVLIATTGSPSASPDSSGAAWTTLALDSATGKELWSFASPEFTQRPVVTPDAVYIYTTNSPVYALDPTSGRVLWQSRLHIGSGGGSGTHMVFADGVLYVGQRGAPNFALDATTGRVLWQSPVSCLGFTVDGSLLAARDDAYLLVYSAHDGSIIWDWYSSLQGGAPLAANGKVFVESSKGLVAFNEQQ